MLYLYKRFWTFLSLKTSQKTLVWSVCVAVSDVWLCSVQLFRDSSDRRQSKYGLFGPIRWSEYRYKWASELQWIDAGQLQAVKYFGIGVIRTETVIHNSKKLIFKLFFEESFFVSSSRLGKSFILFQVVTEFTNRIFLRYSIYCWIFNLLF